MSELRIVKGNDFTILYKIIATYADGTVVPDFNLQECTNVQILVHKSMGPGTASLKKSISTFGSYTLQENNVLEIQWDGILMLLGTYTIDFSAKFNGVDIRTYSSNDLVFDIVNTNEEANIPAGMFVVDGQYQFDGDFILMFGSQVQANWDETNTSSPAYIKNKPDVYIQPAGGIPKSDLSQSVQQSLNKADTAYQKPANGIPSTDMTSAVQASLAKADTAYQKPSTGIPASDIASGVIPDVSQFITRNVNDLVNYYLKSETYTKTEVQGLIAAINQFHYEIYPSTSAVANPQNNVLYLIGPTGTGNDKYEEYVYANNTWVKIGDTSIDLSGYVTTQALNAALASYSTTSQMNNAIAAALANYTTTANLNTLLAAKQDKLTFDNVPTEGSSNPVKSGGVYSSLEQLDAQIEAEQDSIKEEIVDIAKPVSFSSIPMLCGQPMILFGNGTPQESIVPTNWIQFLDGGYNWTGLPSALGQTYISTAVNSGGRYTAVWNGYVLKWVNS